MVTICNKDIPNELNELTIQQFEDITEIHANPKLDNVEKHLEVFKYMGVQEVEDMEFEDFKEAIRLFNTAKTPEGILLKRFENDGYTYQAYDTEFKLTAKDTKHIEKILASKHKGFISEALGVIFKRTDLSKTEHYTDAHIKLKSKILREMPAEVAVPYLVAIAETINKQVESLNDSTEGVAWG